MFFAGKYTTHEIHKNYIWDPSGLFSIISHMISLISSFSLKLYLNSLVYHRNTFRSSSKVFGNLRNSLDIFGNFRKMFQNIHLAFGTIVENLRKSSENHQKCHHQHVYIIKRTLHSGLKIWILFSCGKNNILLTRCAHSQNTVLPLKNKIHIFVPPCNILYIYLSLISNLSSVPISRPEGKLED